MCFILRYTCVLVIFVFLSIGCDFSEFCRQNKIQVQQNRSSYRSIHVLSPTDLPSGVLTCCIGDDSVAGCNQAVAKGLSTINVPIMTNNKMNKIFVKTLQ